MSFVPIPRFQNPEKQQTRPDRRAGRGHRGRHLENIKAGMADGIGCRHRPAHRRARRAIDQPQRAARAGDRDLRAGEKFADSDLIGIPYRIVVGAKTAGEEYEVVRRATGETLMMARDELLG